MADHILKRKLHSMILLPGRRVGLPALIVSLTLTFTLPHSLFSGTKLSKNSPFLPPGHGDKPPEKPEPKAQSRGPISREIEFRGIVEMNGVYRFSIYNKKEEKGYWLKANAYVDGITVNSYDASASTIAVLINGRSERIALLTATEEPLAVAYDKNPKRIREEMSRAVAKAKLSPANQRRRSSRLQNQNIGNRLDRNAEGRRRVILPKKD